MHNKARCIASISLALSVFFVCAVIEIRLHLLVSDSGMISNAMPEISLPAESDFTMVDPDYMPLPNTFTGTPDTEQRELDVLRRNGATQNLSQLDLYRMSYQQLSLTCQSYLDSANVICRRKLRMGNIGDGGWDICDDVEVRPRHPCIIYSFGIANDFSFDDEVAMWYKCHVYSFDPTMYRESYNRAKSFVITNRSYFVHFHNLGVAANTYQNAKGWKYYTFSDIRAMLGHSKSRINIIKMDVESHEWDVLHQMISTGQMKTVDQFLVEYHIFSQKHDNLLKFLSALRLLELEGFGMFYTHKNQGCEFYLEGFPHTASRCFEVHYRRISGGSIPKGERRLFVPGT